MAAHRFEKWEGLGNDFIVVAVDDEGAIEPSRVPALCDRRLGIGADGVLLVLPKGAGGVARMRVRNADGSTPEMCGNGIRCVALFLAARQGLRDGEMAIETDSGLRVCRFSRRGETGDVDVDMGVVRVLGPRALTVAGKGVDLVLADAGNPHAIAYRADPMKDLAELGPALATHTSFERGTNVELVRWRGDVLSVAVWERGVGPTLACGTGACAVAAVAVGRGEAASGARIRVGLPGGELTVTHDATTGRTRMTGPARRVFTGEWSEG